MKRLKTLFFIFIFWGVLIAATSLWLICSQQKQLKNFAGKISSKQVSVFPTRAAIYDCNGVKIAWTEWDFYVISTQRSKKNTENFLRELDIEFNPVFSENLRRYFQSIPPHKVRQAVLLARKYRIRIHRNIVRRTLKLSPAAQHYIGHTMQYYGISGIEKKYDLILRGQPGFYHIVQGAAGKIERNSLKVMIPMQEGTAVHLKHSLLEIQSGLFMTEGR